MIDKNYNISYKKIINRADHKDAFENLEQILGSERLYGKHIEKIKNIELIKDYEVSDNSVTTEYRYTFDAYVNKKYIKFDTDEMSGSPLSTYSYYDETGAVSDIEDNYYAQDAYEVTDALNELLKEVGYEEITWDTDILCDHIDDPYEEDEED